MHRSMFLFVAAAGLGICAPAPQALAQGGQAAQATSKTSPEAKALLDRSRAAIAKLSSMSYTASAKTEGIPAPSYTAEVRARRVDAGGWAISTKGTMSPAPGAADASPAPFEVVYDGVTSRALREKDKAVMELSTSEPSELRLFFMNQNAGAPVAWEIFDEKPLAGEDSALAVDGKATVDGAACEILRATQKAEGGTVTLRYFIDEKGVPRRVERIRAGESPNASKHTQVLVLSDLKTDQALGTSFFVLQTPEGYTVKSARPPAPKRAPRERAPAGQAPEGNGLLAVGTMAPDWTLQDASGKQVKLSALRGRVVVLDFWATWCGPCKMAMPSVQKLHEKYKGKAVSVFGLNCWESGDAPGYMESKKFTYGLLLKGDDVAKQYKVSGIPTFYVIGPTGEILWNSVGFDPEHADQIGKVIDKALEHGGL